MLIARGDKGTLSRRRRAGDCFAKIASISTRDAGLKRLALAPKSARGHGRNVGNLETHRPTPSGLFTRGVARSGVGRGYGVASQLYQTY